MIPEDSSKETRMCQATTTIDEDDNDGTNNSEKKVAFGAIADTVHPVIPKKSELTEEDIDLLWCTASDLDATKREIMATLVALRSNSSATKNSDLCSRGLEQQTDRVRKFDAIKATNAMLGEQKRQKSLGINDPEELAKVYRAKAVFSQETALRMAREDEEEAEMALAELDAPKQKSMFKTLGRALQDIVPTVYEPYSQYLSRRKQFASFLCFANPKTRTTR
jgi:hypothetical protein